MELLKTYINGFDEEIGGGIPKGHMVMVCGMPGTMKSSIALSMLYNNALKDDKKCLYITFEEERDSIKTAMKVLNMVEKVDSKLLIADLSTFRLANPEMEKEGNWLNTIKAYIERMVINDNYELVVIDSIGALYSLVDFRDRRKDLFHFFRGLKKIGATIVLIAELDIDTDKWSQFDEGFLVDGIIRLKFYDVGETDTQLRIRCLKMRHIHHYHGNLTLMFREDEFQATHTLTE